MRKGDGTSYSCPFKNPLKQNGPAPMGIGAGRLICRCF